MKAEDDPGVSLARRLRGETAVRTALLLDFDGTIAPIAPTPDGVAVSRDVVESLDVIGRRLDGAFGVISGRAIASLDRYLAPLRPPAAGLHGVELRLSDSIERPAQDPGLGRARRFVQRALSTFSTAAAEGWPLLEDKDAAFALHWRGAPDMESEALALMSTALAIAGDRFRLQRGSRVAEILPAGFDKGGALRRLMAEPPFAGGQPIYCGDDLTDEAAFAAVHAAGGLSVKIGPGPTCAMLRLPGVAALHDLLRRAARDP